MIVGLSRELEWHDGAVVPRQRRVIELPVTVDHGRAVSRPGHLAPVINIRLEPESDTRTRKWIGVAAVLGAVAFTIVAGATRQTQAHMHPDLFHAYRSYLQLGPDDDYDTVIRKLGHPASVGTRQDGDRIFRTLTYTSRHYSVVLMGSTAMPNATRYIGAVDLRSRVLDAVRFRDGSSAERFLKLKPLPLSPGVIALPSLTRGF
jgi:hypothetical protein